MKELTDKEIHSGACHSCASSYDLNKFCIGAKWYREMIREKTIKQVNNRESILQIAIQIPFKHNDEFWENVDRIEKYLYK